MGTNGIWTQWVTQSTITCSTTTIFDPNAIWYQWTDGNVATFQAIRQPLTAEQQQRLAEQRRESEMCAAREREAHAQAEDRAKSLMLAHLTPEQRKEFIEHGWFTVEVDGERFRIRSGTAGNVERLERKGDLAVMRYCIHPVELALPKFDVMLAQKLALEADRFAFEKIANKTDLRTRQVIRGIAA